MPLSIAPRKRNRRGLAMPSSDLRFLSVCSGIEAVSVAWAPLGWKACAFSEVAPFPCALLKQHYPEVPNLGDMNRADQWTFERSPDLLVGGTPCQSFSVAGKRAGLKDPRGRLMLAFLSLAERLRPAFVVWENVPGVLSSNRGRDFGAFLWSLGNMGYRWAYRVLDAQWFGVPQRRRRVFVVASLGEVCPGAVLFESESLCRDTPSRGKAGTDDTGSTGDGVARCYSLTPGSNRGEALIKEADTSTTLLANMVKTGDSGMRIVQQAQVRRLTVTECERLQGFPDDYTAIPYRGRAVAADSPRIAALGNSMAVPVVKWIGERIARKTR